MRNYFFNLLLLLLIFTSCAKDRPYLSGHLKRAHDAIMVPCDPYGLNRTHTCIVFSAAFRETLYIYDATAGEMVLAPIGYFPLKVPVGRATDLLVPVMSADARVPWMFAVDHSEAAVYPVRLFESNHEKSFGRPKPTKLARAPFKMAATDVGNKIIGLLTFPEDGGIELVAFDRNTGEVDPKIAAKSIKFGTKPNYVEIDNERKVAVFSDEANNSIHVLDLSNIDSVLTKGETHMLKTFTVSTPADRILLSKRDFGKGQHLYAVLLSTKGNDVSLVNIDTETIESTINFNNYPMAAYFPDAGSAACCSNQMSWFSVVTIKGELDYVLIKNEGGALKLTKSTTTDMTSENNLALSKLHVKKIIGGYILPDKSIDREELCKNHRQTFYIASYGNTRAYLNTEPVEMESHGYSCEGESLVSRFGHKH